VFAIMEREDVDSDDEERFLVVRLAHHQRATWLTRHSPFVPLWNVIRTGLCHSPVSR
jgi:hypothetical protein